MKGAKQTQGVCSYPLYFDGLAHHTVPGRLSVVSVPQPHLLLWYLPKALCASKFPSVWVFYLPKALQVLITQQNLVLFSLDAFSGVAFKAEVCKPQI